MKKIVAWFEKEHHRAYLYRVLVGLGGVAAAYGLVTTSDVALVSGLVATIFALPAAKTSTQNKDSQAAPNNKERA